MSDARAPMDETGAISWACSGPHALSSPPSLATSAGSNTRARKIELLDVVRVDCTNIGPKLAMKCEEEVALAQNVVSSEDNSKEIWRSATSPPCRRRRQG